MGSFIDRSGRKYGRLTVLHRDMSDGPASGGKRVKWVCECDCGNTATVTGHGLARGYTQSCGCLRKEMTAKIRETHKMTKSPEYFSWYGMKQRCGLTGTKGPLPAYEDITVCERWANSFENFLGDMGPRPEGTSLDRINVYGNYEPSNCRWATDKDQTDNKKTSLLWRGKTRTLKDIAIMEGVNPVSFRKRLRVYGDTPQEAIDRLRVTGNFRGT